MVVELDLQVKALINELKNREQLDSTIVVFTSDNGGLISSKRKGHDTSAGRRGTKGTLYDGGFRVPAIIRYPRGKRGYRIPENRIFDGLASITDLYRTITDMVGVSVGEYQATDSISLRGQLLGVCPESTRKELYTFTETKLVHGEMVREGNWKLIHNIKDKKYELYNLGNDPSEQNDLRSEYPDKVDSMKQLLTKYQPGQSQKYQHVRCPVESGSCKSCQESTEGYTCCLGDWKTFCGKSPQLFSWNAGIIACTSNTDCPQCMDNKQSPTVKSCCAKGASWHKRCGDNEEYDYDEGLRACAQPLAIEQMPVPLLEDIALLNTSTPTTTEDIELVNTSTPGDNTSTLTTTEDIELVNNSTPGDNTNTPTTTISIRGYNNNEPKVSAGRALGVDIGLSVVTVLLLLVIC